jgi:hypothetical protein
LVPADTESLLIQLMPIGAFVPDTQFC